MQLEETLTWRGLDLVDRDGDRIGSIEEIYQDTDTGEPEWALVHTGLFGTKKTFVPLRSASQQGDGISVPYEKSHVKDAPNIDADGALSHEEEQQLYRHYDLDWGTSTSGSGVGRTDTDLDRGDYDTRADAGRTADLDTDATTGTGRFGRGEDVSGATTDDAMTRSEEELRVGTTQREAGRARLRKCVVTENVETTVPVQREEVRIEREPITDANRDAALSGPEITEEEHEVVLHAEEPVVEKRVVPQERVRLETDTVTEERTVSEEIRKERIESDADDATLRGDADLDRREDRL